MILQRGARVGPYEVLEPLGAGGMGEVHRARDNRLGRDVAIKVVRGLSGEESGWLRRFELEARTTGGLNHPNILSIFDVGTHEGSPYLVSELLQGETLASRLARGPLPWRKAVEYALQIAEGLGAAHAKGVVHRDLKPSNLFVTEDERIKILDFGLAKRVEEAEGDPTASRPGLPLTGTGRIVGTIIYMSPEQARGEKLDPRSDIFSLGVVLHEMLSGVRCFERASEIETLNATLEDEPPSLPENLRRQAPQDLELVVRHCLQKARESRYQSARDLAFHLSALLGQPSPRRSVSPLPRARLQARWSSAAVAIGAGLAVAALGLFLGLRLSHRPVPEFQQLTFQRGTVHNARFAPDGATVVYTASWGGQPVRVYSTRPGSPESSGLNLGDAALLAISSSSELAVLVGARFSHGSAIRGTLARLPLAGGAPREVLSDVEGADWSPDGTELAVVHVVDGKYRLEYPPGHILYEAQGWIADPRIAPDGRQVAFLDFPSFGDERGSLCVVGRDGEKRDLSGWKTIRGLAWRPDGGEIWFSGTRVGANQALYATDLEGSERLLLRTTGSVILQDIDTGGRTLVVEGRYRMLTKYRQAGPSVDHDLSWFDGSFATSISEDGKTLVFLEVASGSGDLPYKIYLRRTDGSPAVRLGEGDGGALSPDGKWVAAILYGPPSSLVLLPTGPGQPRSLDSGPLVDHQTVAWFPDGQRLLIAGREAGSQIRLYAQPLDGGLPRPISAPGFNVSLYSRPVSPDGQWLAALDRNGGLVLLPVDGGAAHAVPGFRQGDVPTAWAADGRAIYAYYPFTRPWQLFRLELDSGLRTPLAEIEPADPAGVRFLAAAHLTPMGKAFAFSYSQLLSDLFLVSGGE